MFVDAGDIINEGVIEFVKKSEKYPSNLTIAGHTYVRGKDRREVLPYENIAVDLNEFLENSNGEKYYLFLQFPWGKIYQTEIINQYGIRFDETIDYAEDALFIFEYLKYLDNVSFFSLSLYGYVYAEESLSKNVPLEKLEKLDKINDKIIDIYNYRKIKINYSLFSVKTRNQTKRLINSVINDEVLSKKEKINYIRKLIRKERVVNSFKKDQRIKKQSKVSL